MLDGPAQKRASAHARAPGRCQAEANLSLGRDFAIPPGPKVGPRRLGRLSRSDGHPRVSVEQKRSDAPAPGTLAHSVLPPPSPPHPTTSDGGESRSERRPRRRHGEPLRRRACSPQGERAAVEKALCGARNGARRRRRAARRALVEVPEHGDGGRRGER